MTLTTFFILLILLASIVIILGVLTIRVCVQMAEQIYFPSKPNIKKEAKKRYERKSNINATKRIPKSPRKV
jgi:hypothetical protein